jgi:hypothetical protein
MATEHEVFELGPWDALARRAHARHGLIEIEGYENQRWLKRWDGSNVALYNPDGSISVKIKDSAARDLALSVPGATTGKVEWFIDIPADQSDQWDMVIGWAAVGSRFKDDTPSSPPEQDESSIEPELSRRQPNRRSLDLPASPVDGLVQLTELHAQGALTDEEFAAAKARLLGL